MPQQLRLNLKSIRNVCFRLHTHSKLQKTKKPDFQRNQAICRAEIALAPAYATTTSSLTSCHNTAQQLLVKTLVTLFLQNDDVPTLGRARTTLKELPHMLFMFLMFCQ